MNGIARFFGAHKLWLVFAAALIPLLVLLGLQYGWLCRLEEASAIAHKASLRNALDAVATEVEFFYRTSAERALTVPAAPFTEEDLGQITEHWKRVDPAGIRRFYLVDYTRTPTGNFYVLEPGQGELVPTPASDESLAVVIACLPWQTRVQEARRAEEAGLHVNEQDPDHRIIMRPVIADGGKIVGVVAVILDDAYLRERLLPRVVAKTLPAFFPEEIRAELAVSVRDHSGTVVVGDPAETPAQTSRKLAFVFGDWTLGLHSVGAGSGQRARASFTFNMTLVGLLGLVLLAGIGLALGAAGRAMRLSQMKSDFVSNVSHELRTPLASIRVFAEHLRAGRASDPNKVREYGEFIETEGHRLSRLIENLLDFSRIESDRKTYRFEPTDLAEVIQGVLRAFQARLDRLGFDVALELPDPPLPPVPADPDALGQVVHNLLDNAVKYASDDKRLQVRLRAEDGFQLIAVSDHGLGIPAEEQKRIFERFHRVGSSLVHDVKGSGLGLAIVHHVVSAHGGAVVVDSELGRGSTFTIRLPAGTQAGEGT